MQLIEELRLQHPFVALAAPAEAIDAIAQRAVALAVELLDQARGELAVRRGEGHAVVEIDQVALVDARRRRVDDDEHLGGEVLAPPVEDDARDADGGGVVGALLHVEMQRCEPMLAVDDQVLGRWLVNGARAAVSAGTEGEPLRGKQQHRARNRRLRDGRFVEVLELLYLGARQRTLKRLVVALDLGDELSNVVVLRHPRGGNFLALAVEAANKAHLRHQVLGAVADEVENAILLANLRRLHGRSSVPPPPGPGTGANIKENWP